MYYRWVLHYTVCNWSGMLKHRTRESNCNGLTELLSIKYQQQRLFIYHKLKMKAEIFVFVVTYRTTSCHNLHEHKCIWGECSSVLIWGTMLQVGRSRVRVPVRSLDFSIDLILPSTLRTWGSTEPLTQMSTGNLPGGKGRPAHKADNLTAVTEPII
jgi:hypothetical protein